MNDDERFEWIKSECAEHGSICRGDICTIIRYAEAQRARADRLAGEALAKDVALEYLADGYVEHYDFDHEPQTEPPSEWWIVKQAREAITTTTEERLAYVNRKERERIATLAAPAGDEEARR